MACLPNSVGLKPEPARNASTRAAKCSLNVLAMGGIKAICSYAVNEKKLVISNIDESRS
jgi:hypothetical protein